MSSWNRSTPRVNTNKNAYVTTILQGGLGNRIFQVLAGQHFAEKTGRKFVIDNNYIRENPHERSEDTMKQLMQLFPSLTFYNGESLEWNIIEEEPYMMFQYQPDIFKRFPGRNIVLDGYFNNSNIKYRINGSTIPSSSSPFDFKCVGINHNCVCC